MTIRIQLRRDSSSNWTSANPILAAGEIGYETNTGKYKIGNGQDQWNSLVYSAIPLSEQDTRFILASTKAQNNGVASLDEQGKVPNTQISSAIARVDGQTFTGNVVLPASTVIGNISATELNYLDGVTSAVQTQLNNLDTTKAAKESPTFTGTIVLPSTTSIGEVSATELSYVNGVTSGIQSQLDAKASATDLSSHASDTTDIHGIADTSILATTTGTQTLTNKTLTSPKINENVAITATATELNYVDGVTSPIQTQLDTKASTTDLSNHSSDTTNIHGIADTSVLLTTAGGTLTGHLTLHADPSSAMHAATKQYVDGVAQGLHIHEAVHVATSASLASLIGASVTYDNGTSGVGATLTLAAPLLDLDSHTLANGDRILVKNESNAAHNGIYTRTSSTVLTRATDFDTAVEIAGGDFVFVENGTLYNSTGWVVENEVNTVGTDNVLWTQFSGAGTFVAGNGITITGNTIAANTTVVAPLANPTFTGTVTVSGSGIAFTDGTQTKQGVASITTIYGETNSNAITTNTTLTTLEYRDSLIEVNSSSTVTLTVPTNSAAAFPIGTSFDIVRMGTGAVSIVGDSGVTVNATPGTNLRARYSSATLFKRGTNSWLLIGDLTA